MADQDQRLVSLLRAELTPLRADVTRGFESLGQRVRSLELSAGILVEEEARWVSLRAPARTRTRTQAHAHAHAHTHTHTSAHVQECPHPHTVGNSAGDA